MNCTYCPEPAMMRCRKHNHYLCGSQLCLGLHRFGGGDCEFVEARPWEPMDWVVAIGSAIVIAAGILIAWVHR